MYYTDEQRKLTAERMRKLREGRGLSHEALKEQLEKRYGKDIKGTSVATLKGFEVDYEKDHRFSKAFGTRIDTMCMLADFYGVSVAYLLGETEIQSPDVSLKAAAEYTGLTEKAIKTLLGQPEEMSITNSRLNAENSPEETLKIVEQMFREGAPIYAAVVNEILEKNPALLTKLSYFLYVDDFPLPEKQPTYKVGDNTYTAMIPSDLMVKAYLEDIKDEVKLLVEKIKDEKSGNDLVKRIKEERKERLKKERKGKDGK